MNEADASFFCIVLTISLVCMHAVSNTLSFACRLNVTTTICLTKFFLLQILLSFILAGSYWGRCLPRRQVIAAACVPNSDDSWQDKRAGGKWTHQCIVLVIWLAFWHIKFPDNNIGRLTNAKIYSVWVCAVQVIFGVLTLRVKIFCAIKLHLADLCWCVVWLK